MGPATFPNKCLSQKAGSMMLNRFCIDEEAGFEFSGLYNLETNGLWFEGASFISRNKAKG